MIIRHYFDSLNQLKSFIQPTPITHPLSSQETIQSYINKSEQRWRDNANNVRSYSDLKKQIADAAVKEHVLSRYPKQIRLLHEEGHLYIHDRSDGIAPYCHGIDFYQILGEGLWTPIQVGGPAKHFSSAMNQSVNILGIFQKEFAGAQAIADINTLMAPLIYKDGLDYKSVKQIIQQGVFDLGFPTRWGFETPFGNWMLNAHTPEYWKDKMVVTPGMEKYTYGEFYEESMMFMRAFNEVLSEGDYTGQPFTFPIPTINIVPGTDWNDPIWDEVFATEAKFGSYYFMNYIGTGYKPGSKRSMCCRFTVDYEELADAGGRWSLEGSTGSLGIVSINMAKIGYRCRDDNHVLENLEWLLEKAKESLLLKDRWVRENLAAGLFPMCEHYNVNFDRFFHTIGMIGFDEMFLNLTGKHFWEDNNPKLAKEVMEFLRQWLKDTQVDTEMLWNAEMTPGEQAASTLASIDKKLHPGIKTLGGDNPYYSTLLTPPSVEMDVVERIDIEQEILPLFSGGTVHRVYLGESNPNPVALKKLAMRIIEHSKIPYLDFAATFSICSNPRCSNFDPTPQVKCSVCGSQNKIFNRITGYYRDILGANDGKQQEFWDRTYINL